MLDHLRSDLKSAIRRLRTSPGYTAVSVITLGLGIGASTAIFSAVDGVLLKSLPYRDPGTLMQVWVPSVRASWPAMPVTRSNVSACRRQAKSCSGLAAARPRRTILTAGDGEPERVAGASLSTNYFNVLGVSTHLGRTFVPADSANEA